jgi:hypothetical protein
LPPWVNTEKVDIEEMLISNRLAESHLHMRNPSPLLGKSNDIFKTMSFTGGGNELLGDRTHECDRKRKGFA